MEKKIGPIHWTTTRFVCSLYKINCDEFPVHAIGFTLTPIVLPGTYTVAM